MDKGKIFIIDGNHFRDVVLPAAEHGWGDNRYFSNLCDAVERFEDEVESFYIYCIRIHTGSSEVLKQSLNKYKALILHEIPITCNRTDNTAQIVFDGCTYTIKEAVPWGSSKWEDSKKILYSSANFMDVEFEFRPVMKLLYPLKKIVRLDPDSYSDAEILFTVEEKEVKPIISKE